MAGKGGYKHRKRKADRKRTQRLQRARENVARIRNQFESRGQAWEPHETPAQMAALTHDARRLLSRSQFQQN